MSSSTFSILALRPSASSPFSASHAENAWAVELARAMLNVRRLKDELASAESQVQALVQQYSGGPVAEVPVAPQGNGYQMS